MATKSNLKHVDLPAEESTEDFTKYDEAAANATSAPLVLKDEPAPAVKGSLTAEQQLLVDGTTTKAVKIRGLLASGMTRGEVAKTLGIRYQHVRNVEITPIKKA